MVASISRSTFARLTISLALVASPSLVVAQDADEDAAPTLPMLGECGGAALQVLSVAAPFGEALGEELTSGRIEVEYLLPENAANAFISFSVPDGAGLNLLGSQILEHNPDAANVHPDGSYSSPTMAATITQVIMGEPATVSIDLVGSSEAVYIEKWGFSGVDLVDFMEPPYTYGDHVDVFLMFDLDGANHQWSSTSSSSDCFVR